MEVWCFKFEKLSFGLGSEYKYDWGRFENRGSFNSSSKGHVKDFAFFGNAGFKIDKNTIFCRSDFVFLR